MAQRHRRSGLIVPAIILLVQLAGCATQGMPGAEVPPPPEGRMSSASESLLARGRAERNAGELAQAAMTLERALRIEPDQPALWLELARVHLDDGNFAQAEQMARKAGALVPPGSPGRNAVDSVLDEALRRQGR